MNLRETLALACMIFVPVLVGQSAGIACGGTLQGVNDARDDDKMSRCRSEGRAVRRDGGTKEDAWDAYDRCMTDAGFR